MTWYENYETINVSLVAPHVLECKLNRPRKLNSFDLKMWEEVRIFFTKVAEDSTIRVVMVSGEGRMFTSGLDFGAMSVFGSGDGASKVDAAQKGIQILRFGKLWQESFSSLEKCGKVVIACVHNGCIGAGVEMISAADIRICTADSYFNLPEVDIGLAADVGGLQRFPKVVGNESLVRELVFSGRNMGAEEALRMGFVSQVLPDQAKLMETGLALAKTIAAKSPVAVFGAKTLLNYSKDHTVEDSLRYALTWNMAMVQSSDMNTAVMAKISKTKPVFPNLPDSKL